MSTPAKETMSQMFIGGLAYVTTSPENEEPQTEVFHIKKIVLNGRIQINHDWSGKSVKEKDKDERYVLVSEKPGNYQSPVLSASNCDISPAKNNQAYNFRFKDGTHVLLLSAVLADSKKNLFKK